MPRRAAILATIGGVCAAISAQATNFTVTNTADSGSGSLRRAVTDSNADTATTSDTITFSLPVNSTISLGSDLEAITSPALVFDSGLALVIDGNDSVLFQNASTSHAVTFDPEVTYDTGDVIFEEATSTGQIIGTLNGRSIVLTKRGTGTTTLNASQIISLDAASSVNIEEGTFIVNGQLIGGPKLRIEAPAFLGVGAMPGQVTVSDVTVEGMLDVEGQLTTTGALLVEPDGILLVETGGTAIVGSPTLKTLTNNGVLVVDGSLTADSVVINPSGVLSGDGTVTASTQVFGIVAPDTGSTEIGSLAINGRIDFEASSTYSVDIGPGNMGDEVQANNAITIDPGAQLVIIADPALLLTPGTVSTVTVLRTTAGGLSGRFVATDYAFFDEDIVYGANSLTVTLESKEPDVTPLAGTPNQSAVAELLDAARPTATGDLETVFDSLRSAQATEVGPLLDAIGGESLTAFATARQILGERTGRALHRRARDLAFGEGRAFYLAPNDEPDVAADGGEVPIERDPRAGAWLDGIGLFGELEGDTGEADVESLLYGGTLGADAWIAEHFVLGLAAGYARSDVDLDGREADVFGDTVQGALYGGFVDPRGYLSAYGRYAYTFQESTRRIESSVLSRHAHADWDAQDYGAGAEAGVTVASFGGFALQPVAGVDWMRLTEESYRESDAGSLGLIVDPDPLESTAARFGGRVFGRMEMGKVGTLAPELRAFYQHLYGDRERVLEARLSGAPGFGTTGVRGPELPRENVILGIGWGVGASENLTVSFDYDAVLGSDRVEHQANIAARVVF